MTWYCIHHNLLAGLFLLCFIELAILQNNSMILLIMIIYAYMVALGETYYKSCNMFNTKCFSNWFTSVIIGYWPWAFLGTRASCLFTEGAHHNMIVVAWNTVQQDNLVSFWLKYWMYTPWELHQSVIGKGLVKCTISRGTSICLSSLKKILKLKLRCCNPPTVLCRLQFLLCQTVMVRQHLWFFKYHFTVLFINM